MYLKIGVVTSRFNEEVTAKLEEGALNFLDAISGEGVEIEVLSVRVPGAIEIPLACKALFAQGCDGVVALGAVIRGETSHYDHVCNSVERGITALMLEYARPIGFGVLTTDTEEQALERCGGSQGHKGEEAARVTIEMIGLLEDIAATADIMPEDLPAPEEKAAKIAKASKASKSASKKTKTVASPVVKPAPKKKANAKSKSKH